MNLDKLKGMEDNKETDDSLSENKPEMSNTEKEELCRSLINEILDSNHSIVENFNNGNISEIKHVVEILKERIDFNISDETLNNIVGEEIITR